MNKNYIDKKELKDAFLLWQNKKDVDSYEFIGRCIISITEKILTLKQFRNYRGELLIDMKSNAIFHAFQGIKWWNNDKASHPFTWIYRIVYQNFQKTIKFYKYNKNAYNKRYITFFQLKYDPTSKYNY